MSADARISTALPTHPKTKKLVRRLGPGAAWSFVVLILWARANKPDGDLSGMTDEDIELACDWGGDHYALVTALCDVAFLDGEPGARRLHDWADHQPWSAGEKSRSQVARENASKKWGRDLDAANKQKRSERLAEARRKGTHSPEEWNALREVCGTACLRCGATDREIVKDHIVPIYLGGSDGIDNLQPVCRPCNASKGPDRSDLRPAKWLERLQALLPNACKTPASDIETPAPSPSPSPSPKQKLQSSLRSDSSSPAADDDREPDDGGSGGGAGGSDRAAAPPPGEQPASEAAESALALTAPPSGADDVSAARTRRLAAITADAVAAFNAILAKPNGRLAKVTLCNEVRRRQVSRCLSVARDICRRINSGNSEITREFWTDYFEACARDPWLRGETRSGPGHENYVPDFELMTRPAKMTAIFDRMRSGAAA